VSKKAKDMRELILSPGQNGVVLRDVGMYRGLLFLYGADEFVILIKGGTSNLLDGTRNSCGVEHSLTLRRFWKVGNDIFKVITEAHVKQSIGFI
jgi:hypothetical protein